MNPRYILDRNTVLYTEGGIKLHVDSTKTIFVDLLEPMQEGSCNQMKVRLFFPAGSIKEGTVVGFQIKLYNKDSLFDGRFNSTQQTTKNKFEHFSPQEKIVLHDSLVMFLDSEDYTDQESVVIKELFEEIEKVKPEGLKWL